jgi:hypothetical protein
MVTLTVKNLPNCIMAKIRRIMPMIITIIPINSSCSLKNIGNAVVLATKTPMVIDIIMESQT